jgi:flagellar hook assembly protein FlgD
MWVGIPMSIEGKDWLNNDVKIRIRVAKPYERYLSTPMDSAAVANSQNRQLPMYRFETQSVATENDNAEKAKNDLDLIQAVPNPYYAYAGGSGYEENALTNKIKITNLPVQCVISIYNVNGTLIRQITKDEQKTSVDWDLTNFAGVPIAGGVYIIHVHTNSGDKIIKWFGGLRTPDLNVF